MSNSIYNDKIQKLNELKNKINFDGELNSSFSPFKIHKSTKGRVITFYSYKGGVGRSRALANVAAHFSLQGKSVICLDFDLEAPGLYNYFINSSCNWESTNQNTHLGLIDYFYSFRDSIFSSVKINSLQLRDIIQKFYISKNNKLSHQISYIGAGAINKNYKYKIANFDWRQFYEEWNGGALIDDIREKLISSYDYVLIDSRTGITDISGICTVHLPDILIAAFTPGSQSRDGLVDALKSIETNQRMMYPNRQLHILPLPCRVDHNVAREMYNNWYHGLLDSYLSEKLSLISHIFTPAEYYKNVSIEYFPRLSYDDIIESLIHDDADRAGNSWKYKNITEIINYLEFNGLQGSKIKSERFPLNIMELIDKSTIRTYGP